MAKNKTPTEIYDCIIIGAGAAGLACARKLLEAKQNVLVLEARDRIGGRAFTTRDTSLNFPIELGAEFIHGAPSSVFEQISAAGLSFYDLVEEHLESKNGKLQKTKSFEKLEALLGKLDKNKTPDRSVADFLKEQKVSRDVRELARTYVEGFHAADTEIIGERALAVAENSEDDLNGKDSFRITEGYDKFMASFLHGVSMSEKIVRLNTLAKKIEWKKGSVEIAVESTAGFPLPSLKAKKVVVTVPIGVLKASLNSKSFVDIQPRPKELDRALEVLHMGHCLRITFRFRSRRLWEDLKTEDPIAYLHAEPGSDFPTWWTMAPMRAPLLVAWQGGPRAAEFARLTEAERVRMALETLSTILGIELERIQEELITWYAHDWSNDPYSYGAYTYVGVDGDRKSKRLSEAFENTLYFSGEATHTGAERGTVDGAIETGVRTAKQILGET
jgi:monoamine oxidase